MQAALLEGRRVLVVEDEYLIADDLRRGLAKAGAVVIGPAPSVQTAFGLIAAEKRIDAAILDVNLGGETAYPLADMLAQRRIPFVFATGYDAADLLPAYQHVPRCEKPVDAVMLARILARQMG